MVKVKKMEWSDEKISALITIVAIILAVVIAIWVIPEPTGDSSVYEQYTEEMTEAGRHPNGSPIGDEYQREAKKRMQGAGIWWELGP